MSIHYKNGNQLQEFASKVEFDDSTRVLTVNGVPHQTFNAEVVEQLPSEVDKNTFYFVTYDVSSDPPEGGYLTKDEADRYYLSSSLSTNVSADINDAKVLLPTAKAIKEYVSAAIQSEITQAVINSMYPVGSIYLSVKDVLPPELTSGGMTWTPINGGQGLWVVDPGDDNLGAHVGGILPKHTHDYIGTDFQSMAGSGSSGGLEHVGKTTGTGAIDSSVSDITMGETLRQPSFCVRAWQRTS